KLVQQQGTPKVGTSIFYDIFTILPQQLRQQELADVIRTESREIRGVMCPSRQPPKVLYKWEQGKSITDPLLPLSDPEAIIRARPPMSNPANNSQLSTDNLSMTAPPLLVLSVVRFEDSVAGYFKYLPKRFNGCVEELPNQFTYDLAAVDAVQAVGLELPKDKDDSTLYPRLSSAAIATYRELNALEASVQDKLCGLVLLTLTNDKLDNIINEELELTQADKHRLATDEKYVQSSLSHHLAFHPIQVSVKLHQRLSSGLPTCLLAKQPMINFSSSWVFLEPMQMHHPELVQLYSSAQNSDFTSHLNKVVSFVSARPSKYLCSQARIVLIALLFHLMYTDFPPVNQLVSASVSSLVSNPGGQFLLFEHDTILLIIILLADFNSD
ncbi:hypothetical protein PSTT_01164, partial [Puccinia striiformis]